MKEHKIKADTLKKVMIALAIDFSKISKNKGLSPKEALARKNIFVPKEINDDWSFFNFNSFLSVEDFLLQKIELVEDREVIEEKEKKNDS